MKKWLLFVALAFMPGILGFSPAPFPRTERKREPEDIVQLQGTYKVLTYGRKNLRGLALERSNMKVQISGNEFTFLYDNGQGQYTPSTKYEMKLTPRSSPKVADMTYSSGNYELTMKGIYKIEGKKVTMAYVNTYVFKGGQGGPAPVAAERPTSFDNLGPSAMLIELERE